VGSVEMWVPAIALLAVLAFIFQIVAVIVTARSVRQVTAQIERQSKDLAATLSQVQSRLLEVSESLEPVRAVAQDLATNLGNMSETLQNRAEHADAVIKDLMTVGQDQAAKIDFLVSDTVEKFEQTTETIQKDLLKPAIEISSFIRGIRGGIDALFSRKQPVEEKSAEEELFI
jgi:predicted transcriptional regulator